MFSVFGWLTDCGWMLDVLIFGTRSRTDSIPIPYISYFSISIPIQEHGIMVAYTWIPSSWW